MPAPRDARISDIASIPAFQFDRQSISVSDEVDMVAGSRRWTDGREYHGSSDRSHRAAGDHYESGLAFEALAMLRNEPTLEWSFLAPSTVIEPGARTGIFRLGGDQLLVDAKGESRISLQDYAVAMIDELEHPAHVRQRFTVGY